MRIFDLHAALGVVRIFVDSSFWPFVFLILYFLFVHFSLHKTVVSRSGYPADKTFDISVDGHTLVKVKKGGWADRHTDLGNYIGYQIVKINSMDTDNFDELVEAKRSLIVGQEVVFTVSDGDNDDLVVR